MYVGMYVFMYQAWIYHLLKNIKIIYFSLNSRYGCTRRIVHYLGPRFAPGAENWGYDKRVGGMTEDNKRSYAYAYACRRYEGMDLVL